MSFTKIFQRTLLPFDNNSNGVLSPITERSKIAPLFGGTPLIEDILKNKNLSSQNDLHGRGSWGIGEDDFTSYKEKGDEFMLENKITEILSRLNRTKRRPKEKWVAITIDGREIEFDDYNEGRRELIEKKIPYRLFIKKTARDNNNSYYSFVKKAIHATFKINSYNTDTNKNKIGTAFYVKKNIFMTCAHCIQEYDKNEITKQKNITTTLHLIQNNLKIKAKLIYINFYTDVALIESQTNIDNIEPLMLYPSDKVEIGTHVFCVGSPSGYENNVSEGILSSKYRNIFKYIGAPQFLFTDVQVFPGSSGGPLISCENGQVIGMMAIIIPVSGLYGFNAAIPSEYLIDCLAKTN